MKMPKQVFLTDFFLITNFCVKIVANTNKKNGGGILIGN